MEKKTGAQTAKQSDKQIGILGIIGIMLASSLTVMVGNAITPALPALGEVYGLGNYASWLVTAPALGVVATAILFGKLIDKKGPYLAAVFGLLCYGFLGVAGAFMPNAVTIFIDRFFLGAATAAIMSATVALISVFFQGEKQLRLIAIQGMSMEFGGVIFLSVSGMLAGYSWQYPFFIYGLGFVAFLMLVFFVPRCGCAAEEEAAQREGRDAKEALQKEEGDTEETLQSERGDTKKALQKERGDTREGETALKATGKGAPVPLVLLIAFLGMLMFFTAMVSLPGYLQVELGYSPSFTGYYLAALDLVAVLAAGLMPNVVKKVQEKGCLTIAFTSYGTAFLLYFLSGHIAVLWTAVLFAGVGFGFSTPLFNSLIVQKSTADNKGMNISFCTMAMFLGQFLSAMLVSFIPGKSLFLTAVVIAWVIGVCIVPVANRYRFMNKEA